MHVLNDRPYLSNTPIKKVPRTYYTTHHCLRRKIESRRLTLNESSIDIASEQGIEDVYVKLMNSINTNCSVKVHLYKIQQKGQHQERCTTGKNHLPQAVTATLNNIF